MAPQPEPQHPRRPWTHPATLAIIAALVASAVLLAFTPAFDAVFVDLDDLALLVDNDMYRGLAPANRRWMFTTTLMGHYQPLTWLSYALDFAAGGLNPEQFHRTSILIHAIAGVS